jgi:hypothetical protein
MEVQDFGQEIIGRGNAVYFNWLLRKLPELLNGRVRQ